MNILDTLLKKAKEDYKEAVRGYDYQEELIKSTHDDHERRFLEDRKKVFAERANTITDIFGSLIYKD